MNSTLQRFWDWLRQAVNSKRSPRRKLVRLSLSGGPERLEQRQLLAAFTSGDLVVLQVGNGSGGLSSSATPVFLKEFSPAGSSVQSLPLPTTVSGSNRALTLVGNDITEGALSRSVNSQYLTLGGYDSAVGATGVGSTSASTVNRVVALVNSSGTIDTTTVMTDAFSGATGGGGGGGANSYRSVATIDGTAFWVAGQGGTALGGTRYIPYGNTGTSTNLGSGTPLGPNNTRIVEIFNGQLYVSLQTGSPTQTGVATVGTGIPTTTGQSIILLPNLSGDNNAFAYVLLDRDATVPGVDSLYIADQSSGLLKYSFDGTAWTADGSIVGSFTGLTGVINGSNVDLYATSGTSAGNTMVKITDTAAFNVTINGAVNTLATAPANTAFRGVAFAPTAPVVPAPTLSNVATSPLSINEGSLTTVTGTIADFGATDTLSLVLNWGDGAPQTLHPAAGSTFFSVTHQYLDNLSGSPNTNFPVALTLSNLEGTTVSTAHVIVNNVAPTLNSFVLSAATINEGGLATLTGAFSDPGTLDTFTLSVNWGNGTPQVLNLAAGATTFNVTHAYPDNIPAGPVSNFTISLSLADDDGGTTSATTIETVNNVAPLANAGGNRIIAAGLPITLSGSQTDPGTLDTFTYLWHLVSDTNGQSIGDATTQNLSFIPSTAGSYTFRFTVTDDDEGVGVDTAVVVAPGATMSNVAATTPINENGVATVTGSITNSGTDTLTLLIDWSDGSTPSNLNFAFSATSFTVTHRYVDNVPSGPSSNFTVRLALSDQQAHVNLLNTNVIVNDLPPALSNVNMTALSVNEGDIATLTGTVNDPSPLDIFMLVVNWGDGQTQSLANQPSGVFTLTHQYLATLRGQSSSGYIVSVAATDDDGLASTTSTSTITVNNIAPALTALSFTPVSVNEGGSALLTGTIADPGLQDTFALVIDWGDGNVQTLQNLAGGTFSLNHKYLGTLPGQPISNFTVSATVTDNDAASSPTGTAVVAVNNVAPSLSSVGVTPSAINENGIAILTGFISDPGALDTFALVINWNDGKTQTVSNLAAGIFSAAHRYADNIPHGSVSNFTVSVSAVDNDAAVSTISTATVTVNNVAPTAHAGGNQTGAVGVITTLHGTATDPSPLDTFTFLWHLVGDSNGQSLPDSTSPAYAFIPSSGGTYTFNFSVTDDDGGTGVDTVLVTVAGNTAPILSNLATNTPINENGIATLSGKLTNGGADTMTLVVNWSDGSGPQSLNFSAAATSFTATHQYLDNVPSGPSSNATVRLTLSDQHGNSSQTTSQVVVNDLPPTVTGLHLSATAINENGIATLTGTVTDPGTLDTFTLVVNWGDGAPQTVANQPSGTFVITHQYRDNIPHGPVSNFTVSLTATDDDGLSAATVTTIETVNNVSPTANAGGIRTATAGTPITLTGSQTDPGTLDTFTYLWHLVSDTNAQTIGNVTTQNLAFTPTSAGTYTFGFTVTDDDGGVGVDTAIIVAQGTGGGSTSTFHFDFNSASNATAPGYTGVRGSETFTAARSFGWRNPTAEFDRNGPSPLLRDGVWGTDNTFRVAIDPSQTIYTILVTIGDNTYARNVNVYAEGTLEGNSATNAGQFKTLSFTIATSAISSDGILDLEFKRGGADPYFVVNGLDIVGGMFETAQTAATGNIVPPLTEGELAPVVQDAIARWAAAGITPSQVNLLEQTQFEIEDIPTATALGLTLSHQVIIDPNAAGHGWYVDATPGSNAAFSHQVATTELRADPTSPAYSRMDLLTVVMHEMGHELGLPDLDPQSDPYSLMNGSLDVGIRRLRPPN